MTVSDTSPLVVLTIRVPKEHAEAVKKHAEDLARKTGLRVTPSAAGAAVLASGLVTLGLIEAPTATKKKGARTPRKA